LFTEKQLKGGGGGRRTPLPCRLKKVSTLKKGAESIASERVKRLKVGKNRK